MSLVTCCWILVLTSLVQSCALTISRNDNWTSNWMSQLPANTVNKVPLVQLVLPGSHDSFSYNLSLSGAPRIAVRYAKSQEWNVTMYDSSPPPDFC